MSKLKIKSGLIGILLLAGLFAGWEALLIITVLILLFCEINENIKKVIISVKWTPCQGLSKKSVRF